MSSSIKAFDYDFVLSLNASHRIRECLPTIERTLGGRRMLAATLDHRFFNIDEKNHIKKVVYTFATYR